MKKIERINNAIVIFLKYACIVITIAFLLITFLQVIMRYVFVKPLRWSEQLCRYLFVWSILLYMPVIKRERNDLGFDLILKKMPKRFQQVFEIISNLLILGFAGYYFYSSILFITKTMNRRFAGINLPYWSVYGAQAVGSLLLFFFTLELIIVDIINITKIWKEEHQ